MRVPVVIVAPVIPLYCSSISLQRALNRTILTVLWSEYSIEHFCTSSVFPIARSGRRCGVILAVPRGECLVDTFARVCNPITLLVRSRARTRSCCAREQMLGRTLLPESSIPIASLG